MHVTGGVNMYLYMCAILLVCACTVCVCMYDIKSEYHAIRVKPSVNLISFCIKHSKVLLVLGLDKFRSITSLSKIDIRSGVITIVAAHKLKFFRIFVQVFRSAFSFMLSHVVLLNVLLMLGLLGGSC